MDDSNEFTDIVQVPEVTAEQVIEDYHNRSVQHGNDIDLLNQSMMLIQSGHYRKAMRVAQQVQVAAPSLEDLPKVVDKPTAQAAFLKAHERARPLFEKAALDIEGAIENSRTMAAYEMVAEMLRSDPDW